MKRTMIFSAAAGLLMITAASCTKDSGPSIDTTNDGSFKVFTQNNVTTVQNLMADTIVGFAPSGQPVGTGKFTFFSLEKAAQVASSDSASNKWDIAVRGTTILTNNGTSGPGNGGAFVWIGAFDNLTAVPADSTFRTDNAPSFAVPTGSGNGWYNYDGASNLVTPLPGRVLVVRTASGKYAKIEILNYYRGGATPDASASDELKLSEQRYYTFRYIFQGNGSTNF